MAKGKAFQAKGFSKMMTQRASEASQSTGGGSKIANMINHSSMGNITFSGRGHGRKTPHGRGPSRSIQRSKKQDMLYFVRDIVRGFREYPPHKQEGVPHTTYEMADHLVNNVQYFDCTMIEEYVNSNYREAYPDSDVPPHPDVILPADHVGLYMNAKNDLNLEECLFICQKDWSQDEHRGRIFKVSMIIIYGTQIKTRPLGQIINLDEGAHFYLHASAADDDPEVQKGIYSALLYVAFALQTINQPRFVTPSKRDVSMVKRQAFRKATGRFTPDSWNLVSWNVDKPVKAKPYEEGGGGKQALHFRRGHWRKAKEQWERARWSETRNRWEIYVHGYEAGHPAFGVKKSYHMPRKEAS